FKIPVDKARALLHRAPGAVTKAVPEEQAKTVAEILSEAGLSVEVREGTAAGPPLPLFAAAPVSPSWPSAGVDEAYDEAYGEGGERGRDTRGGQFGVAVEEERRPPAGVSAADGVATTEVDGDGGTGSLADDGLRDGAYDVVDGRDDSDEEPLDGDHSRSATTAGAAGRQVPEPGYATTTPPRDPMKTTLTRNPPDLERSGLRRRIGTAATLPALLTLVVTLLALAATLLPVLRAQQARRAADTVAAVAATIEGLSGGLPLSAPLIRAELRQVEE